MDVNQWDQSFARLKREIALLEGPQSSAPIKDQIRLTQKQSAILQYELALEAAMERVRVLKSAKLTIPKKCQAIIFWSFTMLESLKRVYHKKASYFGQALWLGLLRSSLSPKTALSPFLEDVALMEMATREVELKNRERQLKKTLRALEATKKDLHQERIKKEAGLSNMEAGTCLQRSFSLREPKKDVAYSSLKRFINNLSTASRATSPQEVALQKKQKKLSAETDLFISECKSLMQKEIGPNRLTIGTHRLRHMQERLASLEALRDDVTLARREVEGLALPPLHPIMVQDGQKSAR